MILQPNQRRRRRLFRTMAGIGAVVIVSALLASGLVTPPPGSVAHATTGAPTASTAVHQATDPPPSPAETTPAVSPDPTVSPDGCLPAPAEVTPAIVAFNGPRTGKVVALTFDDGTNPANVQRILRILKRKRVNATFFPTGREVERYPELWQKVAKAGFAIGNHTYSHASLAGLCYQLQLAELQRARDVIGPLGIDMLPVMRPPYEAFDLSTRLAAGAAATSHVVLWDVDTLDWTGVSAKTIVSRAVAGRSGSIVLMHTFPANTTAALPRIIRRYRERGYTFVTLGTLLGIPGAVPYS